jgi:hypothetical protein
VKTGDRVGTLNVYQGSTMVAQIPLTSDHDVRAPNVLEAFGILFLKAGEAIASFFGGIWRAIFG